jgi:hypothetical protein
MRHESFLPRLLLAMVAVTLLHPVRHACAQGDTARAALAGHENEHILSMSGVVTRTELDSFSGDTRLHSERLPSP